MNRAENNNRTGKAIIIGAGPAGLTAAYELLTRTSIKPVILEKTGETGGLSRTVVYKGNRMDIGGHRFFSKSDRVLKWWLQMMPLEEGVPEDIVLNYHNTTGTLPPQASPSSAMVHGDMMVRPRRSRIYFLKKFFKYPLSLSYDTISKLGLMRTIRIMFSYLSIKVFPPGNVVTLEDFFISRFGTELYHTFFKSYTEKVWGVACSELPASWGVQRIKDLSLRQAIKHMVKQVISKRDDLAQKGVSTSLIEQFLYPRLGPGQLWEKVADEVKKLGGEIHYGHAVDEILCSPERVMGVTTRNTEGKPARFEGDLFFSTMPLSEVVSGIRGIEVPQPVAQVAEGLQFRDFITIGLLVKKFSATALKQGPMLDNWIYIQDGNVLMGRLQIFKNWSKWMVADPDTQWLGLEYFCNTTDEIWRTPDDQLIQMAEKELLEIGIIEPGVVMDGTVVRQEKTYPSYTGTYAQFDVLRSWIQGLENFYPIGRNGMHRYNNSDHSMLTAMIAVDHITGSVQDKNAIWEVNTEDEYHEERSGE
ncbi:MAG TPA: NAD(P)/FAD-dependent oxidoreductase [Phnomibacter sp.]|nr:NAD(P)/FAD-dependent oxidoreductase [Phnomibacter sp.]